MTNKTDPFDLSAGVPKIDGDLRPKPKIAERISKRVLFVVFGVLAVVVMTFLFALDAMENKPPTKQEEKAAVVADNDDAPSTLTDIGRALLGGNGDSANLTGLTGAETPVPAAPPIPSAVPAISEVPPIPELQREAPLTPEQQQKLAEEQARHQRMLQARAQGMMAKPFVSGGEAAPVGVDAQLAALIAQAGAGVPSDNGLQPVAFPAGAPAAAGQVEDDQERKAGFLAKSSKENVEYHPHLAVPARSKNEIKTGSFIPMVLEQSINSDLPGQITARVTEDVYDSITGCRMLIPAMSKVVGRYDSKIALGQGRMLIAWNSLVFRDGAELNLGGLQGYDTSGQAGLESDVDNHYWRLFGLTFGLSMITSGVQLSIPQPNAGQNGSSPAQSPAQIVAAGLAQQYGNLGSQIIGRYMSVQPTLRNFAGERFVVMVPRTIIFNKVWRQRCG